MFGNNMSNMCFLLRYVFQNGSEKFTFFSLQISTKESQVQSGYSMDFTIVFITEEVRHILNYDLNKYCILLMSLSHKQ